MEKLKGKHNHTLTNILKVFTFALVLLFPFLVFMPSAFYYGFNEHAQIEIPQKINTYQTNEVNNANDLIEGNVYKYDRLINNNFSIFQDTNVIDILDYDLINFVKLDTQDITYTSIDIYNLNNIDFITIDIGREVFTIESDDINDDSTFIINVNYNQDLYYHIHFYFKLININDLSVFSNDDIASISASDYLGESITDTTTISENLSNSWENMWQTPLFAWTENTPFTATTNAFASVFNISQQSGIYNLLAYFITITGIYLVIDIVIGVATMLTHMIAKQD